MRSIRLVGQQCRAAAAVVDLFCGAAHVDVDDLRAKIDIDARRLGQLLRFTADQLYHTRLGLARVVHAPLRFARAPQTLIRAEHFRRCERRAKTTAELAKGSVSDSRHRCEQRTAAIT